MTISLPTILSIPGSTAATLRFHGDLSARDAAMAFVIAWLAANDPESARQVDDDLYDIDDNGLRAALGMGKSRSADDELKRFERLQYSNLWLHDIADFVRPPTLASMDGPNPIRAKNLDGSLRWRVDSWLIAAFTIGAGERPVGIPSHLLRAAKSRYGLQLMLRVAAWQKGYAKPAWEHSRSDEALVLRVPPEDLLDDLGIDITIAPSTLMNDVVAPAIEDISKYGDVVVEAKARRTKYRGGRLGKVHDLQISIYAFEDDEGGETFEQRVKRIAMERIVAEEERARAELAKAKPFKRPVRRPKPKTSGDPVPDTSNIIALTRRPAFDAKTSGRARGFVMPPALETENTAEGDAECT